MDAAHLGRVYRTSGRRSRRGGFTLIETAIAAVIIGVGVVAIIESQQAFLRSNGWSSHVATATYLANEIRELTRNNPRHDPVTGLFLGQTGGGGTALVGWGPEPGEVQITDLDDMDDFDDLAFGPGGDYPGPIDAFGNVIPKVMPDGTIVLDDQGEPVPMEGWAQRVVVEKVDPFNYSTVRGDDYEEPARAGFPGRAVDQFPLRVTVFVTYQGPFDSQPRQITQVSWIVP